MNYLGHLYLSGNDTELMQANLYGDFVKGSNLSDLPEIIQRGITMHRSIDHFIDNHPAVRQLLPVLRADLPKVAGIAVDLYFDHLLAKYWQEFHPQPLQEYLRKAYAHFDLENASYSGDYLLFLNRLIRYNWISHYPDIEALDKMCRGVSSRLSFSNTLVNGKSVFLMHEKPITESFFSYMQSACEHFLTDAPGLLS